MLQTFYKYLILHHKACIPGIGVFSINTTPAQVDSENNRLLPPSFHIHFSSGAEMADKRFYTFLEHEQHIEDVPAIRRFNDFACSLKEELYDRKSLQLQHLGTLLVNNAGELEFHPLPHSTHFFPAVPLSPVAQPSPALPEIIAPKTKQVKQPTPDVSTTTKKPFSNSPLGGQGGQADYWWVYAIALAIISIAAILYYYLILNK